MGETGLSQVKVNYNATEVLFQCQKCQYFFTVGEAPGAAGITPEGKFIGDCPICGFWHRSEVEMPKAKHTDHEVERLVIGLEVSGDNLCQRLINLLWQRGHRPAQLDESPAQMVDRFKRETGLLQ